MPEKRILLPEVVNQVFERALDGLRLSLQAAADEVLDAKRSKAVVDTVLSLVRSRLDNASSLRAWRETRGAVQEAPPLNQLYQAVGGWVVVLQAVLEKMAASLESSEKGLAIIDDTSIRKYGMAMEGVSLVHCANIDAPVAGHNVVTLMLEDASEGVFSDLRLKVNRRRPKSARRPGRFKAAVQQARQDTKFDLAVQLLRSALKSGFDVRCVLFDAWYFCAEMAEQLEELGLRFVSRAKSNRVFVINGAEETVRDFLGRAARYRKQVPGTDHLFYQAEARIKNGIQVKIVATWFFQGLNLRATVLVTTDFTLSGAGVVQAYLARWATEQGYKTLKHELAWANYHTTDFAKIDALLRIGFLAYGVSRTVQRQLGARIPLPRLLKLRRQADTFLSPSGETPGSTAKPMTPAAICAAELARTMAGTRGYAHR